MYPSGELSLLALRKTGLRRRIAARRCECEAAARRVVQPLVLIDSVVGRWRRLPAFAKFAAVPSALAAGWWLAGRAKTAGTLLRWGPLVIAAVSGLARAGSRQSRD